MSPRFLIHPGYPKTGSTSLQAHVFARHSGLKYLSNHSAPGDAFRDAPHTEEFHALLRDMPADSDTRRTELWRDHMLPAVDQDRLNVISDETFLNHTSPPGEIAKALKKIVGEAQVLIVVREQADILRSNYDMYPWLRGDVERRYLNFSQWLVQTLERAEGNVAGVLYYGRIIAHYREVFGTEAVTVISYDKLFGDADAQAQLCARLRIDGAEFATLIAQKPANTSADHGTKKLVRRVLGPIKGSSFLSPKQIAAIRNVLGLVLPQRTTRVTPSEQQRIRDFYQGHRINDLKAAPGEGMIL